MAPVLWEVSSVVPSTAAGDEAWVAASSSPLVEAKFISNIGVGRVKFFVTFGLLVGATVAEGVGEFVASGVVVGFAVGVAVGVGLGVTGGRYFNLISTVLLDSAGDSVLPVNLSILK